MSFNVQPASQIRGCCRDGTAQLASDRAVQIRASIRLRGNEGFGLSTLRLASHHRGYGWLCPILILQCDGLPTARSCRSRQKAYLAGMVPNWTDLAPGIQE